jgi:hypothetical protein
MKITWHTDPSNKLTILTATGELKFEDLKGVMKAYKDDPPPKDYNILWDFREAYPSGSLTSDITGEIASLFKERIGKKAYRKTAYVVSSELMYGMCRMYLSQLEVEGVTRSKMVFDEMDEAMMWLAEHE